MMDFSLRQRDLEITDGDLALCPTDGHAVAQAITIRLRTVAGEWFLDTQRGLPYFTHILGHNFSERLVRQLIVQEIGTVPGVVAITDYVAQRGQAERSILIKFNAALSNQTTITINESMGV